MTREEAIEKLERCADEERWPAMYDTEVAHSEADQVLCELLISLGYEDVVRTWEGVPKWYA